MALLRMTDKKLAANRANAKKSKGPVTPAGKEKVSRNACKHHIFGRKFNLHPVWADRIRDRVLPLTADVEDPEEHLHLHNYLVFSFWLLEVDALFVHLLNHHIRLRHGSLDRGLQNFYTTQPTLFNAIQVRLHQLHVRAERAEKAWKRAKARAAQNRAVPQIVENELLTPAPKKLTLAAAAGAGASATTTCTPPTGSTPCRPWVNVQPTPETHRRPASFLHAGYSHWRGPPTIIRNISHAGKPPGTTGLQRKYTLIDVLEGMPSAATQNPGRG